MRSMDATKGERDHGHTAPAHAKTLFTARDRISFLKRQVHAKCHKISTQDRTHATN
jgi:hypothetical protein